VIHLTGPSNLLIAGLNVVVVAADVAVVVVVTLCQLS